MDKIFPMSKEEQEILKNNVKFMQDLSKIIHEYFPSKEDQYER